jgi:DUF2889 family protein
LPVRVHKEVPVNPEFGRGIFRRRIRIEASDGRVDGALEDNHHGFVLTLHHAAGVVCAIDATAMRIPYNTCPAATLALRQFVGQKIQRDSGAARRIDRSTQCTHLFNLAMLCLSHVKPAPRALQFDVAVADPVDGLRQAELTIDSRGVLRWTLEGDVIVEPTALRGLSVRDGFYRWARAHFRGRSLEAAQVLQQGIYVANGRRFHPTLMAGRPALENPHTLNACHTFQSIRIGQAVHTDSIRDFTDSPDALLKFNP